MTPREKARAALKKLDELDARRAEATRLYRELRHRLEYDAYEHREFYIHNAHDLHHDVTLSAEERRALAQGVCLACGTKFYLGQRVREFLDDDGRVVARYHPECR